MKIRQNQAPTGTLFLDNGAREIIDTVSVIIVREM